MLYLHVKDLHKSFNEKPLLAGIDFSILKGQKVALVAKNGAGKSTLIKILKGDIEVSQGSVVFHKNSKVRFLDQTFDAPDDMSVRDAVFLYDNHIGQLIRKYEILITDPDADQTLIHETLHEIEKNHGREYDVKVKSIMSQLQLTSYLDQTLGSLSGGEAKRVALAKALLDEPDLLILDEPTNHLDLDMIERLEKYLKKTDMTLLMVTHDRYFLERVCSDIYELDRGKIYMYPGNYENFLIKKAEREELEQLNVHKLKQFYKQELERIRKAPRARQTKSVERSKKFYGIEDEFQERKQILHEQSARLTFDIEERRLGSKILKIHHLSKSYGEKMILKDFSYNFKQGERIGVMGKNGVGKSTFVNMLTGKEAYDSGSLELGPTIKVGYYQQKQAITDSEKSVLDYVRETSDRIVVGKGIVLTASQLLERFLFTPRQQQSKVSSLSGGERRRLHLLIVLIANPNFLILDEPTNDLDLITLTILEDFLLAYQGCLIIISHDRFFMDKLVEHLFIFQGEGQIFDFRGTYTEYKNDPSFGGKFLTTSTDSQNVKKKSGLPTNVRPDNESAPVLSVQFPAPPKKLSFNEKREFEQLIIDIHALEERKHAINSIFQQENLDYDKLKDVSKELTTLVQTLETKEARWMELAERA